MGYNEDLQGNNAELQAILEAVEALPDAADYVIGPETGTVGQVLVVKELDENGRPAKWETVDFPEGGGLSEEELSDAVNTALAQAKESGEFDGHTPIKGTDYWTEADKAGIVEDVLEQMPEGEDGIPVPETAAVGQTVVVKTVDENGKPTEWEPVNLPEGLPNPEELISGQPLVPFYNPESGVPGSWGQDAFIPANVAASAGQSVRWTGDNDEYGNSVWEGYFPVVPPTYPEIGQTIVVSAVDEWGHPTEWEAKDLPKGGVTGDVVRPKDLQDYTPKHYLKTLGMLSEQDGSILPSISGEWADVAYGDGVTVMVASGTNIAARKVDGHLWEAVTLPRSGDWRSVVYFKPEKAFIAVDNNGYWAFSYNTGANWVDGEDETGIAWVCAGDWKALSTDTMCVFQEMTGVSWPTVWYLDATSDVYNGVMPVANPVIGSLVYGEDKFVVATGNQIGISTDIRYGVWEWHDLPEGVEINEIAYTDGLFMGHGYGKIYYSSDGITWEAHSDYQTGAMVFPNGLQITGDIFQFVTACNGRFLFYVPLEMYMGITWGYWVLSIPAHDVYAWDFMSIDIPDISSMQIFTAGDRFLMLPTLSYDYVNWVAGEPFAIYSDDGLGWTPNVPKLTAPSGGGSYSDWSAEEKAAVLNDVIAALPVYNGEVEDV